MSLKPFDPESKADSPDADSLPFPGPDKLLKPVGSALKSIQALESGEIQSAIAEGLSTVAPFNNNVAKALGAGKLIQKVASAVEGLDKKSVKPGPAPVIADHPLAGRAINDFAVKTPPFMPESASAAINAADEQSDSPETIFSNASLAFSDETRLLRFYSALPANISLQIEALQGHSALSELFTFQLTLISKDAGIDLKNLIGKNISIGIQQGTDGEHYINGYVSSFAFAQSDGGFAFYQAEIVPWLAYLKRRINSRIFQDKTVMDVLKTIFHDDYPGLADYEFRITKEYKVENYIVQYDESDENFVCRLLEKYGLFYYFEHGPSGHKMVIADDSANATCCKPHERHAKVEFNAGNRTQNEDAITQIAARRTLQPAKVALNTFNFKAPLTPQYVELPTDADQGDIPRLEVYDGNPAFTYKDVGDGAREARQRLQVLEWQAKVFGGASDCRALEPGRTFILTNHEWFDPLDESDADFLVLSVTYSARNNYFQRGDAAVYSNTFTCIRRKIPFRPLLRHAKPTMRGPQTATVVGPKGAEIHTDKYGRIKVQFHWDRYGRNDEASSCWIRVSQPWAGQGWGTVAIPRIAQEVIIDYLEGDPDRPVCTGRLYNETQSLPYAFPEAAHMMGFKSRSTPGGGGYCEMVIHDRKGRELINIHSQKDMTTTVQNNHATTVNGPSQTNIVTNGFHVTTVRKKVELESQTEFIHLKAATGITLEVGASKIHMDASGKITIEGVHVDVIGSTRIDLNTNAAESTSTALGGIKGNLNNGSSAAGKAGPVNPSSNTSSLPEFKAEKPLVKNRAHRIGQLSSKYETSGRGPGTVSSGKDDKGGVSYGSYQLASRMGTVSKFLASEGAKWDSELKGLDPTIRNGDFSMKWKEIAARSPAEFHDAQHRFIQRTHYDPIVADIKKQTGLDVAERSNAVKDVVWSTAVQHGGARKIILPAVKSIKLNTEDPQYDQALINAIYDQRTAYVNKLEDLSDKKKSRESSRYKKERADALTSFEGD